MVQGRQRTQLVIGCLWIQATRQQNRASKRVQRILPTTRAASRMTCSAGGAACTISLVMPVSWVMKLFTRSPAFIKL